jgi:tetratricopeptide (TPR) repeat protein
MLLACTLAGRDARIEQWRALGFQAKTEHNLPEAIVHYGSIVKADSTDYDARLALARLYLQTEQPRSALPLFATIYTNDSTDVEALNGMGACYNLLDDAKRSVGCYEKALHFLPRDIPLLFALAKAYANQGTITRARETYQRLLRIDDTYAEAWAGIARMYSWSDKPRTALVHFQKALELDPTSEAIRNEYQSIQNALRYGISIASGPTTENEENYRILALVSKVKVDKRINDLLGVEANVLLDFSSRDPLLSIGDTARWYEAVSIKARFFSEHHGMSLYGGYSTTDARLSAYGVNWKFHATAGRVWLKNSLTAEYDYFYYWNRVGAHSIADEIQFGYRILSLSARYGLGIVDPAAVIDKVTKLSAGNRRNPYRSFCGSLSAKIFSNPRVTLGMSSSLLDYTYKSTRYYAPAARTLVGPTAAINAVIGKFYLYGSYAYNFGAEYYYQLNENGQPLKTALNVNNWSANTEAGYSHNRFSFSLGGSTFYNPYYRNLAGLASIKILL